MRDRESWGDKPYNKDMNFSLCKQSEPTDKYGTPDEISNACAYFASGIGFAADSEDMLVKIQKGMSNEQLETLQIKKLKRKMGEVGTPLMIANHVHTTLDWLRACQKRKWDGRPMNDQEQILPYVIKGITINHATHLHYDENPER